MPDNFKEVNLTISSMTTKTGVKPKYEFSSMVPFGVFHDDVIGPLSDYSLLLMHELLSNGFYHDEEEKTKNQRAEKK